MATNKSNPTEVKPVVEPGSEKKKKGFWPKFGNFMMMGGFMLVLIVGVGIVIAISVAFNSCKGP
jgi:hypothetical protein